MSGVNKVILFGRLGSNPDLRYTSNGNAVCNFTIATSESWNDKNTGKKQEKTEWHRVVVWDKLAELCNQYLSTGRQAYVEGKLQTRSWEDKDGNKRYTTEIVSNTVQFVGGQGDESRDKNNNQSSQNQNISRPEVPEVNADFANDDIPF